METSCLVLIVEDEAVIALDLQLQLQEMGYRVLGPAQSGAEALMLAHEHRPDLALLDIRLQGPMDGVELAVHLGQANRIPVIFVSANVNAATVSRATQATACCFLSKPFETLQLRAAIEQALQTCPRRSPGREA
jgi:CheY-like chemotaxis protein